MYLERIIIKFGGESGQGINTVGRMLTQSINRLGLYTFSSREYPSLIKGGVASYQIDISNKEIFTSAKKYHVLCCMSEKSLHSYLPSILENGIVIYDGEELEFSPDEEIELQKKNIHIIYLDSEKIALENGATKIMANAVLLGFIWKILKQDLEILIEEVLEMLSDKKIDEEAEKKCLLAGYNNPQYRNDFSISIDLPKPLQTNRKLLITSNEAISLGALTAGMRIFCGYPMTPATSISKFLGDTAHETKIVFKQAENEITAALMVMGSMYMGTRAMTATSGGGFDLMIETISCCGISETPFVVVLAQRIGAGTGVPTWTGTGDINTAVKGGHGDFPRCVISVSDAQSNFTMIQKAFNIADKYQLPVIVLSEKQIAEAIYSIDKLPTAEKIERGLQKGEKRYEITDSGISPRWIPQKGLKPYLHTSDEHTEDGKSTENAEEIKAMSEKRERKLEMLKSELPEPKLYGSSSAQVVFVGYGSSKNALLDTKQHRDDIAYLHYDYIFPLKTETLMKLAEEGKRLILIENNQGGQFGKLITEECAYQFKEKLLKYNGRSFSLEDILDYLDN